MKYILMLYGNEQVWNAMSEQDMAKVYAAHTAYANQMQAAGVMRGGAELRPTTTARSVRFAGGRTTLVDGPFAETKEQLGGYYVVEVDTIEQALAWAEKMPGMTDGTVEVRPLGEGA